MPGRNVSIKHEYNKVGHTVEEFSQVGSYIKYGFNWMGISGADSPLAWLKEKKNIYSEKVYTQYKQGTQQKELLQEYKKNASEWKRIPWGRMVRLTGRDDKD